MQGLAQSACPTPWLHWLWLMIHLSLYVYPLKGKIIVMKLIKRIDIITVADIQAIDIYWY
jgi:hypothetical protein